MSDRRAGDGCGCPLPSDGLLGICICSVFFITILGSGSPSFSLILSILELRRYAMRVKCVVESKWRRLVLFGGQISSYSCCLNHTVEEGMSNGIRAMVLGV